MKKLSALALLLLTAISMQAVSIKGYVIDKKTNEPIIGAIVSVEGQNIGAQTDFDGRFVINDVNPGTVQIIIKSIGYSNYTKRIKIKDYNTEIILERIKLKIQEKKQDNRKTYNFLFQRYI